MAIGRSMAALVAAARHLLLTLSDIKDGDSVFLLDALLSPSRPIWRHCRHQASGGREAGGGISAVSFSPLSSPGGCGNRGSKQGSRSGASKPKPDLRTVLQAKRSSAKKYLMPMAQGL